MYGNSMGILGRLKSADSVADCEEGTEGTIRNLSSFFGVGNM